MPPRFVLGWKRHLVGFIPQGPAFLIFLCQLLGPVALQRDLKLQDKLRLVSASVSLTFMNLHFHLLNVS